MKHHAITSAVLVVALTGSARAQAQDTRAQPAGDDAEALEEYQPESDEADSEEPEAESAAKPAEPAEPAATAAPNPDDKPAPDPAAKVESSSKKSTLSFTGYLQPELGFVVRNSAMLPREQREYGAGATSAGVIVSASVLEQWSFTAHVLFAGEFLSLVTDVQSVDNDGDGTNDDISSNSQITPIFSVEQATVKWQPSELFYATMGQLRIPFTVQQQTVNTALLFPRRADVAEAFVSGSDIGGMIGTTIADGLVRASAGLFNGTGFPRGQGDRRGLSYSGRVDIQPAGKFGYIEGDPLRGALRLSFGAGILYSNASVFDDAGFLASTVRDVRFSGSVKLAVRGLYVLAEALRLQRTDSLSSRPLISNGAYAQLSYSLAAPEAIALAPIARLGWASQDLGAIERRRRFLEAGMAIYPKRKDPRAIKVIAQYVGETDLEANENAHGARLQVQLVW